MERMTGKINQARGRLIEAKETIQEIEEILKEHVPEEFLPDEFYNLDEAQAFCGDALSIITKLRGQIV